MPPSAPSPRDLLQQAAALEATDPTAALARYRAAADALAPTDPAMAALALHRAAGLLVRGERPAEARDALRRAGTLLAPTGRQDGLAVVLLDLGRLETEMGDLAAAQATLEAASATARLLGDAPLLARAEAALDEARTLRAAPETRDAARTTARHAAASVEDELRATLREIRRILGRD